MVFDIGTKQYISMTYIISIPTIAFSLLVLVGAITSHINHRQRLTLKKGIVLFTIFGTISAMSIIIPYKMETKDIKDFDTIEVKGNNIILSHSFSGNKKILPLSDIRSISIHAKESTDVYGTVVDRIYYLRIEDKKGEKFDSEYTYKGQLQKILNYFRNKLPH